MSIYREGHSSYGHCWIEGNMMNDIYPKDISTMVMFYKMFLIKDTDMRELMIQQ